MDTGLSISAAPSGPAIAAGSFSAGALAYKFGLSGPIDSLLENPSASQMAERFKPFFSVLRGVAEENIRIPGNYLSSLTAFPENLHIDIKHKDFQKLAHIRDRAMVNGHLNRADKSYVPAQIRHRERTYDIKLRLKGDNIDHLRGEKWSYRVKIGSDDTLLGMKTFSLQHPRTRNFIYEWLFHQALKREGVIGLQYEFVNVTVNGNDLGIFALEEHFEKRLLESNQRRVGTEQVVLVEGTSKRSEDQLRGRTDTNHMVVFDRPAGLAAGDYAVVRVNECTSATLLGSFVRATTLAAETAIPA